MYRYTLGGFHEIEPAFWLLNENIFQIDPGQELRRILSSYSSNLELVNVVWTILRHQEDGVLRAFGENMELVHLFLVVINISHKSG